MKKGWICLAALLPLCALPVAAYAETTATAAGSVRFDGDEMESSFSSSELAAAVSEMQPGDAVTFQVDIANDADYTTDWYLSNEVLSSLEDTQSVAENGGYTYKLVYTDESGAETVLYDSESVGGEKTSDADGLNEVTDSLSEFFYLDRLESGATGKVMLTVSLDGESQGNAYQDTLAQLKLNFAVERASSDTPSAQPGSSSSHTSRVKTGDVWTVGAIAALGVGVLLMIVGLVVYKRKEEE